MRIRTVAFCIGAWLGASLASAQDPTPGGGSTPPPDLGQTQQAAGTPSPRANLPPPTGPSAASSSSGSRVDMAVGGSQATTANIEHVARVLREAGYCVSTLRGMRTIQIVPAVSRGLQGTWSGGVITFYAHQRPTPILGHTVVHEFGHHVTMMADPAFGEQLLQASGNGDGGVPSEYSRTSPPERVAELVTYYLWGDKSEIGWRPQFQPNPQARSLVEDEFRCNTDIETNYPGAASASPDPASTSTPRPPGSG